MSLNEMLERKISKALGVDVILMDLNQSFNSLSTITRVSGHVQIPPEKRRAIQKALVLPGEIKESSIKFQLVIETDNP